ncbi:SDR family oxidoreductase [Epidermidibacterium keratini]|nr:SDR family oxidoreductase [Epidermidibacterium keratini]
MTSSKSVVVTGAGSGIGRAVSLALLARGHRVALAGRRTDRLEETVGMAGPDARDRTVVVTADVTDPRQVESLFDAAVAAHGRVDAVFSNAGSWGSPGSVDEISAEQWREAVDLNVNGTFYCAAEAVRRMKSQTPQGGRVINNASISAHVPRPRSVAYTTTKHAITGLTKSIELDGRGYGVRATQIDIGNAATEMTSGISKGAVQADGSKRAEPTFDAAHVGELVAYVVELPLDVTMPWVTIAAAEMPWIARG